MVEVKTSRREYKDVQYNRKVNEFNFKINVLFGRINKAVEKMEELAKRSKT